jgi:hypothetical protein
MTFQNMNPDRNSRGKLTRVKPTKWTWSSKAKSCFDGRHTCVHVADGVKARFELRDLALALDNAVWIARETKLATKSSQFPYKVSRSTSGLLPSRLASANSADATARTAALVLMANLRNPTVSYGLHGNGTRAYASLDFRAVFW